MQSQHPVSQQLVNLASSSSSNGGNQPYPPAESNREPRLTFDPAGAQSPGFRGHSTSEHLYQQLRGDPIGVFSDDESEVNDDDDDNPKILLSDASGRDEIPEKPDQKPEKSEELDCDGGRLEEILAEPVLLPPRRRGRRRGRGSSCSSSSTDSERTDDDDEDEVHAAKESRLDQKDTKTAIQLGGHLLLHSAGLSAPIALHRPTAGPGGAKASPPPPPTAEGDPSLEADERQRMEDRDRSMGALERFGAGRLMLMDDERFMPTPPPSASPLIRAPDNRPMSHANGHHWTFEEQFKQLYEMSLEPKRKEFLDDLFSFMQRRGTPVNRIPIMAKQTLDLFGLFRLVVSKGGLVEVINKKLWREITKGLNLPSSITSAAFTLRTQYMKYLYPYECEKLKLSTLAELQAAIDGNRREGRRPGYGYDFSPLPSAMLSNPPPVTHLGIPLHSLNSSGRPSPKGDDLPLLAASLRSGGGRGCLRPPLVDHDARAMEAATRAMEEEASRVGMATSMMIASMNNSNNNNGVINMSSKAYDDNNPPHPLPPPPPLPLHPPHPPPPPSCKRAGSFGDEDHFLSRIGFHGNRFKMANHSSGRLNAHDETPMVVNMEINGLMYRGVLFAQRRL